MTEREAEIVDAAEEKDTEIARLRDLVETAFREGYDAGVVDGHPAGHFRGPEWHYDRSDTCAALAR